MKELLQEYKNTLKLTLKELRNLEKADSFNYADAQAYYDFLKAAETDLRFTIAWLEKGFQPDAHYRGIERNDAYYVMRPYDPFIIERYLENRQANDAFTFIEESYANEAEKEFMQRVRFEESISANTAALLEKAKARLTSKEVDILLLVNKGMSQREIAEYYRCSQTMVSKYLRKIKRILLELGIERTDV